MKLLLIIAASAALALAGCHRDQDSRAAGGKSGATSMQTPQGAATGQASEGSTDDRKAPARPSSR